MVNRSTPEAPQARGTEPVKAPLSSSRRRLLKAGAVPVGLTLASQPVRAWHCNTASAWGSAQVNATASVTARAADAEIVNECWTITEWKNNTYHSPVGYPWCKLGTQSSTYGVTGTSKNYTLATLFGSSGPFPKGCSGSQTVWYVLNNGTTFQKYMVVAKLNAKLLPGTVGQCLKSNTSDQITAMLDGVYSPNGVDGSGWDESKIMSYLYDNWIVRP